jgi:hypothetical protein
MLYLVLSCINTNTITITTTSGSSIRATQTKCMKSKRLDYFAKRTSTTKYDTYYIWWRIVSSSFSCAFFFCGGGGGSNGAGAGTMNDIRTLFFSFLIGRDKAGKTI